MSDMPKFNNRPLCADSPTPEDWFPEEFANDASIRYNYSYTESALRARNICLNCNALDECLEYSLQFENLEGIWAGYDRFERAEKQRNLKITELISVHISDFRSEVNYEL